MPHRNRVYIIKKVWYHQIWIQTYLGFIVLILIYISIHFEISGPLEQRQDATKKIIRPILFLYYEESLVSSNLNSNLLRFHCAHPNVNIVIPFLWVISTVKLHNSNDLKPKIFNPDQVYLRKGWGIRSFIRNAKCKKRTPMWSTNTFLVQNLKAVNFFSKCNPGTALSGFPEKLHFARLAVHSLFVPVSHLWYFISKFWFWCKLYSSPSQLR